MCGGGFELGIGVEVVRLHCEERFVGALDLRFDFYKGREGIICAPPLILFGYWSKGDLIFKVLLL